MGTTTRLRPNDTRRRVIEREIATEYARDRLARALYEVIVDSVRFGPCELPTGEDREWIRRAVARPIREATDAALEILAQRLSEVLAAAPSELRARFDASHHWEELGWE
jgi:hypothetical protein